MKHNLVLNNMKGYFYGMQPGPNHTLIEVYCGTIETCGDGLYDCLVNAVLFLQDYHGNPAPTNAIYASDLDNATYNDVEQAIVEAVTGETVD